jgi:hypothetical protein
MSSEPTDLEKMIDIVVAQDTVRYDASSFKKLVDRRLANRLVVAMIARNRAEGQAVEQPISRALDQLDAFAEIDSPIACILMVELWPIASALRMHDVCDAIDLAICDCKSTGLTDYLRQALSSDQRVGVKRHFENLILAREARASTNMKGSI